MTFSDAFEVVKPDQESHFRLKPCACGHADVVYLHCKAPCGGFGWRVVCLDCKAHTGGTFPNKHAAQVAWNTGRHIKSNEKR